MAATRVMVVEDERIVALNIKRRLLHCGYEVPAMASSGVAALAKIEDMRPDVVLMDIHIEGDMDGIETAAQIPAELCIPVIYLTAYSGDEILKRAQATRPEGYLLKPFSERELHATIQMAMARRVPAARNGVKTVAEPRPKKPLLRDRTPITRWGTGQRSNPDRARARLLDTAEQCFCEKGIAATTITDIAMRAKVTRQTVYRYFDCHADMLKAVVERELKAFWRGLHDELIDGPDFGDYLIEILVRTLQRAQQPPEQGVLFRPETLSVIIEILLEDREHLAAQLECVRPTYRCFAGDGTAPDDGELLALCEWFNRMLASYLGRPSLLCPGEAELRLLLQRWLPIATSGADS